LEGLAAAVIDRMLANGELPRTDSDRETLEKFMVLHIFRHPRMMALIRKTTTVNLGSLEGTHLGESLRDDFVVHAASFVSVLSNTKFAFVGDEEARWAKYRQQFQQFSWNLVRFHEDSLVVGHTLVCTSTVYAGEYRSYGVGLENSQRITVPLSPRAGLLLSRDGRVNRLRAEAFNRSTVGSATQFVAYGANWPQRAPSLFEDVDRLCKLRAVTDARP
jgi:Protein of unknown function (DUF4238)